MRERKVKKAKLMNEPMIKDCICKACGGTFRGGPRAWYCPDCSARHQYLNCQAYKQRKKQGSVRTLGSKDICIVCGAEYTVNGGKQKYC